MPELLVEVGCEELPASFVRKAYTDLHDKIGQLLAEAGLVPPGTTGKALGSPRRLIISYAALPDRQPDATKELRGPNVKAAFGADGKPAPALLGFCRSQGVDPSDLRDDGQYVWVTKTIPGRPTAELLGELLPEAIRSLQFAKSMRWGSLRMRFARPIRWILASLGGEQIAFDVEGVQAGLTSRGHRFYSPAPFPASSFDALISGLRERSVEPDADVRRSRVVDQARAVANGTPDLTEALVEENVFLTEWPTAIQGSFRTEFQALPESVLVTAMAKHEKMFPVRDAAGALTNHFVFIRNSGQDDDVRKGAEWVLNARFNDAKFFFEEDSKHSLEDFLEKTRGIVFQEKLGTVRLRAERLEKLAQEIARVTLADEPETRFAGLAGKYSKADLSTGLVSELASLQGIIGGEYALRENLADEVCYALRVQYDPSKNPVPPDSAGARTAWRLIVADALDKLAGYLGLGLAPTGSSDPYGLRRSATVLIEMAWGWTGGLPAYDQLLDYALDLYRQQGVQLDDHAAHGALYEVFSSRYSALMTDVRHDILEAAMLTESGWEVTVPRQVRFRVACLQELVPDVAFVQTATRPLNIVISARRKGIEYGFEDPLGRLNRSALESAEGLELLQTLSDQEEALFIAAREEKKDDVIRLVRNLATPITRFFDTNMVMADEPDVRYARLTLMHATSLQLLAAGDFSKLEG